jgi:hypothetical protein
MSATKKEGKLRLSLVDVLGDKIGGRVGIRLRHQVLSDQRVLNDLDASKRITIEDLFGIPQGLYRIEVDPSVYLPTSRFVTIKASGFTDVEITCAIDPDKVTSVTFPKFADLPDGTQKLLKNSDNVLTFEGKKGKALYDALDDVRKANVLNLTAKCAATPLSNGKTVLPAIEEIVEIRGDRFFAVVPKELRQETKNSAVTGLFNDAPDTLHTPPAGFSRAGSFKTPDESGNLQLTYFLKGDDCQVDIDIDPASGLKHLFQVLEHKIKKIQTHPYAVRDILVKQQQIDPEYRFVV